MKYYFLAGIIVFSGVVAVVLSRSGDRSRMEADHFSHKRNIVEAETKVRPNYFEDMKFKPEAAVELRAPASTNQ